MKTAGLLALALLSTETLVRAAEDPVAKPTLSARLENPKMADDAKSLTLDFILLNQSDKPVIFAERWNSWGAYQWRLRLHNKDVSTFGYGNPQQCWTRNFLTVVTLEPGKEHRSHCLLCVAEPSPWPKDQDVFTCDGKVQPASLKGYSSISGVFSVREISTDSPDGKGKAMTNWTGEVTAEKIEIPGK